MDLDRTLVPESQLIQGAEGLTLHNTEFDCPGWRFPTGSRGRLLRHGGELGELCVVSMWDCACYIHTAYGVETELMRASVTHSRARQRPRSGTVLGVAHHVAVAEYVSHALARGELDR